MTKVSVPLKIKRNTRIGDLEAETDRDLLTRCFVDKGDLDILMDVNRPESIIVGRTGSGKSALLLEIANRADKCRLIDPNDVSIRFLESSDIIQFFSELGVNLDLFYRLLWRHILTVELLKIRYDLKNRDESNGAIQRLIDLVERDHVKKEALSYFRGWGDKFWLDTDQQLKEVTDKLSRDIKTGFGADFSGVDISLEGAKSLSQERRTEIVHRAKRVVSQIQIKKLSDVLDLLEDKVFVDDQRNYFILVDKLDDDWANNETRYRFIRALIEEIKHFRKIRNAKIIISMRKDLLDLVFDKTRDSGFQQEKYESYLLPLIWSRSDLERLVEVRINQVFRSQYTRDNVSFGDIFPAPIKGGGQKAIDYVFDRSFLRPRDVMQFINECLGAAFDRERVSWRVIRAAEANYSEKRLKSLFEEWADVYPSLSKSIEMLRGVSEDFTRSLLSGGRLDVVISDLMEANDDPCNAAVIQYCESGSRGATEADMVSEFLCCFYRIGAVGVKISAKDTFMWSDFDHASISKGEIKRVNQIRVHKMLYRALGIREKDELTWEM